MFAILKSLFQHIQKKAHDWGVKMEVVAGKYKSYIAAI